MFFLSLCCQNPFLCWESQFTSPPQDALQHCADLWDCCWGSSDSNLVLLLCILASNVHSYQNQSILCVCVRKLSMTFYIFHRQRVFLAHRMDLICSLYIWWEGLGSSSLATLSLVFSCGFVSTSACGLSTGDCS